MTNTEQALSLKLLLDYPQFSEYEFWVRKKYQPGELVIVEGETGNEIYVILSGKLSVCTQVHISPDRQMLSGLCELFDGEEFAHACFFDSEPHSATVKVVDSCELAVVNADKLKEFLHNNPELGFRVLIHWISIILPKIRQSNKRFASLFSWGLRAHQLDTAL